MPRESTDRCKTERPEDAATFFGRGKNVEREPPADEAGGVLRRGKALRSETNPRSGCGTKQDRKLEEDQTLEGLRKVEEGRRPGGTGQYADSTSDVAGGAQNLMGGSHDYEPFRATGRPRGSRQHPRRSLKRVQACERMNHLCESGWGKRVSEHLEGELRQRRGGTGEPNNRYDTRLIL